MAKFGKNALVPFALAGVLAAGCVPEASTSDPESPANTTSSTTAALGALSSVRLLGASKVEGGGENAVNGGGPVDVFGTGPKLEVVGTIENEGVFVIRCIAGANSLGVTVDTIEGRAPATEAVVAEVADQVPAC